MNVWKIFTTMLAIVLALTSTGLIAAELSSATDNLDVYSNPDVWLCRPGHNDLCNAPIEITQISSDNTQYISVRKPMVKARIDCFYIYPTVSSAPTGNSGLVPTQDEQRVIISQFALFASVCRPFAPMYRQVTIAGLESIFGKRLIPVDPELAYADVLAAWRHYLREDNAGRGVVLIGHSQGAHLLARLIAEEIDGQPSQSRLLAAIIPGFNVEVPSGAYVGGTFKHIPLCQNNVQRGCILSYVSFRAETPPPPGSRFGRTNHSGMKVACTDPTQLTGTNVDMALPTSIMKMDIDGQWSSLHNAIKTEFFSVPGMVTLQCKDDSHGSYLAVTMTARDPLDQRPQYLPGDLIVRGHLLYDWGLHLIDLNLAMGNLLSFVGKLEKTN